MASSFDWVLRRLAEGEALARRLGYNSIEEALRTLEGINSCRPCRDAQKEVVSSPPRSPPVKEESPVRETSKRLAVAGGGENKEE